MVLLNAALTALNVGLWLAYGYWWNGAVAVFCGLITVYFIALQVAR